MSASPRRDYSPTVSLEDYAVLLGRRREALAKLAGTGCEILSTLTTDPLADIEDLLERREGECRRFSALNNQLPPDEPELLDSARSLQSEQDEAGAVARRVLSLSDDCWTLADQVMRSQADSEAIMRCSLEATARSIRESAQRRKLDTAYGPACRHHSPVFLDTQQ